MSGECQKCHEHCLDCKCDMCSLENHECHCYLQELEDRVAHLEEELDKLTFVVERISKTINKSQV